ncbi:MAG: hypothetical protein H6733_14400 [Alphaproteobacteria bacterium]|nr:hypothetical protein [Alphaproteobacteria bacterium]
MTHPALGNADDLRDFDLGDPRRTRRLVRCVEAIQAKPDSSFPKVFADNASLEAFYRLVNNRDVRYERINGHLASKAWTRARRWGGLTLVLHDTSEFVVSGETWRNGLTQRRRRQSFQGHHALAVAETGAPIVFGSLGFHPYIRREGQWFRVDGDDREVQLDSGSDRWGTLLREVHDAAPLP